MSISQSSLSPTAAWKRPPLSWSLILLCVALASLAIPTFITLARESWSSEQGEHGPIVLAIGAWLVWRSWPLTAPEVKPGSLAVTGVLMALVGVVYILARIADQFLVESFALYGLGLIAVYAFVGRRAMRRIWFPLTFLIFALPMPFMLTWPVSHHLRMWISEATVKLLQVFGFSVAQNGLSILIDQYEIVIEQACSGMNSLISLSAIGLFYIYVRRSPPGRYYFFYIPMIILFAIVGNFARVIILVLLTHYYGDAVAQGYLHETAGLVTFTVALLGVIMVDSATGRFVRQASPQAGGQATPSAGAPA